MSVFVLKIICRKEANRKFIGEVMIVNILKVLSSALSVRVALECATCVLNLCYEQENVDILIATDGLPLLMNLLGADDDTFELQTATLGALQSISFSKFGRSILAKSLPIFVLFIDFKNMPMVNYFYSFLFYFLDLSCIRCNSQSFDSFSKSYSF